MFQTGVESVHFDQMSIAVHVDDVHEDTIVAKNLTQEHVRIRYTLSVLIGTVVSIGDCFVIVDSIFGIENGCIDQIDLRYEGNIPYSSVRRSFKNKKRINQFEIKRNVRTGQCRAVI